MTSSDPSLLSAVDLAAAFASGDVTPSDVTAAALAAIERYDPAVNAMVLVEAEGALESAAEATRRWAEGRPLSPLDGIPTTVKDILLTRGWPTLRGSKLVDADASWTEDAPAVARLRESGAVFLGKNTTPEFAWKGVTDSLRHGSTGNPWGAALTSGGSSGGAATAVGLGMGTWAVGTDGGGSVRIPAAFTGTVSLKPTFGLVPMYPASPFGTLSHAGPMTRTVRDAALLLDVITGFDSRDWHALPSPQSSFLGALEDEGAAEVAGLRVALSSTLGGFGQNHPEVEAAVRAAAEVLAGLGAHVEEVDPPLPDLTEAFHVLWFTGAGQVLASYGPDALEQVDPLLAAQVRRYAHVTARDYLTATQARMDAGVAMGGFHERWDVLLTPTMPIPAFERGRDAPSDWPSTLWTSWTPYTYPFNMTQQPALSVPCGLTGDRRPIGLQLVGPRHAERRLLAAAAAYEAATPWHHERPTLLV